MANLILSAFIRPEILAISAFIARDSPEAADRFEEAAFETFDLIAKFPELGRHRRFARPRLREVRSFHVKGFDNFPLFSTVPNANATWLQNVYSVKGKAITSFADGHVDAVPPKYGFIAENHDPMR